MRTKIAALIAGILLVGSLTACKTDADVASTNLSKDADNFKINRRVIFYNGISGDYILEVDGFCSVDNGDIHKLAVTCKVGNGYKKHFLGVSDNVTWFAEQIDAANVSVDHYKVIFKPSVIVPDIEAR